MVRHINQKEIENVKKTIRDWIERPIKVPENYTEFFIQWTLLNLYYNAKYSDLREEYKKILKFGVCFKFLFNKLKDKEENIKILIKDECIGNGRSTSVPSDHVKTATIQLREKLGIANGCENCREIKRRECQKIALTDHIYEPFEAILRVIYQIRCNLFHGNKLVLEGDQFERDRKLINAGNSILEIVLEQLLN